MGSFMKPLLYVFTLLLYSGSTTRMITDSSIHGTITYDYYIDLVNSEAALQKLKAEKPDMYATYGESFRRQNQLQDGLQFELRFNDHQSIFELNTQASPTEEDAFAYSNAVIMATEAKDAYYLDQNKKLRLSLANMEGSPVNIIEPYEKHQWTLTGEEKCVEGRTLLEATTPRTIQTRDGSESTTTVQAWYAPDIPVSYGPLGYDGLPGLIMELRFGPKFLNGFTAIALDIRTESKAKEIRKPKAVADMTAGDFQRKILELQQGRQH